ncbi:hypothetical protein B0H21DRAFT_710168 [Amylocystis lapponica]|nr:hypothetical protein B0H21DRAFT_710168 [Amylocystis lapponica]
MRFSTIAAVAATVAAPALVAALPVHTAREPKGGWLHKIETGLGLVNDGASAYNSVNQAAHSRRSPKVGLGDAWNIGKDAYDAYEGVKGAYDSATGQSKRSPKGWLHNIETGLGLVNDGASAYNSVNQAAHSRREPSWLTEGRPGDAWNIGKDAYDAYEGVKGAYDSATGQSKRSPKGWLNKIETGLGLVNNGASAYNSVNEAAHSRREPNWVSIVDDGIKAIGDGANAYSSVNQAANSRRELESLLVRAILNELD